MSRSNTFSSRTTPTQLPILRSRWHRTILRSSCERSLSGASASRWAGFLDLRGVGGSAAPTDGYAAADLAEDVHQLLRSLTVDFFVREHQNAEIPCP